MKVLFTLTVILIAGLSVQAQSLEGSWRLDLDRSVQLMSAEAQSHLNSLATEAHQRVTDLFNDREFIFLVNDTVQIKWTSGSTSHQVSGTWSSTGNALTISTEGREQHYTISELTNSVLIIEPVGTGGILKKFYLNRNP